VFFIFDSNFFKPSKLYFISANPYFRQDYPFIKWNDKYIWILTWKIVKQSIVFIFLKISCYKIIIFDLNFIFIYDIII
jgi:hypothetical protein